MKLITLGFWALFLSVSTAHAQDKDNLRLFAYSPECGDYVLGYSINLMAERRLVGHPEKSCNLSVDYSECTTTLCRVGVQLREWQTCVAEKASQKLESPCNWLADSAATGAPVSAVSVGTIGVGPVAEQCFFEAVAALRERMTILLSPSITSEEQHIALSFNDQLIASLKSHEGTISNILCGHHMNVSDSFPDLPTVKALRVSLLTSLVAVERRSDLFAILRLAFETDRTDIKLARESWFACFTDLEISYFIRRSPLNDLIAEFEQKCKLFQDAETKTDAVRDFAEMKS